MLKPSSVAQGSLADDKTVKTNQHNLNAHTHPDLNRYSTAFIQAQLNVNISTNLTEAIPAGLNKPETDNLHGFHSYK